MGSGRADQWVEQQGASVPGRTVLGFAEGAIVGVL
jgi:hypothetical protein